ncbi:DUF3566 domain-containing protein [Allobranchiibius huperziae]|uniref:DUF3566 domain-containing protein n=1 Tax=Allobranchiibius huperziae TaxID=1874116 RepID=A0A853DP14_9MICO|nr:hypothetical protein [Allobranchiibius huperziae]
MSTDTPNDTARAAGDSPAARLPGKAGTSGARKAPAPAANRGGRPAPRPAARTSRPGRATPRRVRLSLSRVDPWSVFKIAFLLSVAVAIAGVVMTGVLWTVLSGMGVFGNLNDLLRSMDRKGSSFNLMDYIGFGRVMSLSVVIGVIDIFLMTAIATLGAFLYNICSSLVGGLHLTLTDE